MEQDDREGQGGPAAPSLLAEASNTLPQKETNRTSQGLKEARKGLGEFSLYLGREL